MDAVNFPIGRCNNPNWTLRVEVIPLYPLSRSEQLRAKPPQFISKISAAVSALTIRQSIITSTSWSSCTSYSEFNRGSAMSSRDWSRRLRSTSSILDCWPQCEVTPRQGCAPTGACSAFYSKPSFSPSCSRRRRGRKNLSRYFTTGTGISTHRRETPKSSHDDRGGPRVHADDGENGLLASGSVIDFEPGASWPATTAAAAPRPSDGCRR
jgi:hypothetical protein